MTCFCIFLGNSLISLKSKKPATISRSSAEVEYRALAIVSSKLIWVEHLLIDLQLHPLHLSLVYCDNQAAVSIASNPTFHERTKHVEIDCHFFRDRIVSGL